MNIAVCDDEMHIRKDIADTLRRYEENFNIIEYGSGEELLEHNEEWDIIFLDIKMQGVNGIETAASLRKQQHDAEIIFVTGLEQYVFQAYDVGAFHYLMKPLDKVQFFKVLEKVLDKCKKKRHIQELLNNPENVQKCILIKTGANSQKISLKDIYAAEVRNRKVILYLMNGTIEYYAKLYDLERQLGTEFFRCHRAYLVAFEYINKYDANNILMDNGTIIPIAKQKYHDFVSGYLQYLLRNA